MDDNREEAKFGSFLKWLFMKYRIRNLDIAKCLGVSSSHFSRIFAGETLPSADLYEKMFDYLYNKITDDEQMKLGELYIEDKTNCAVKNTLTRPIKPSREMLRAATGVPTAKRAGMEKYLKAKISKLNTGELGDLCIFLFERVNDNQISDAMMYLDDLCLRRKIIINQTPGSPNKTYQPEDLQNP